MKTAKLCSILVVIFIGFGYQNLLGHQIRISFLDSAPHIFIDKESNLPTGALYHLLEEDIGPAMETEFIWDEVASNIPRQLENLEKGVKDASALMALAPSRINRITYSAEPWLVIRPGLLLKKSHPLNRITSIDDILDLRIGYAQKSYISPFMNDPRIQWDLIASSDVHLVNVNKLVLNRVDAAYSPNLSTLVYNAQKMNSWRGMKVIPTPDETVKLFVVFSKKIHKEYIHSYNRAFKAVNGKERYLHHLKKYLDLADMEPLMGREQVRPVSPGRPGH